MSGSQSLAPRHQAHNSLLCERRVQFLSISRLPAHNQLSISLRRVVGFVDNQRVTGAMKPIRKNQTFAAGAALAGFFGGFMVTVFIFSGLMIATTPSGFGLEFDAATSIIIVLTALSIMLTALAIIIAVVGVFGFNVLRREAFVAASEHASEELGEEGQLRQIIERRVDEIVARTQSGSVIQTDFPNPDSEYGE